MKIDWEQRRYEIAKAMMVTVATRERLAMQNPTAIASIIVSHTDALIEKLRWDTGK